MGGRCSRLRYNAETFPLKHSLYSMGQTAMDLLSEFRNRTDAISDAACRRGVEAVLQHIEAAERYHQDVRFHEREEHLNDIVYRTNQAFEGMLREAYAKLAPPSSRNVSAHDIEQYFSSSGLLPSRVLTLIASYRRDWRNLSAHDHRVLFTEAEALVAITHVTTVCIVLCDEIIAAFEYQQELENRETARRDLDEPIEHCISPSDILQRQLVNLVRSFVCEEPLQPELSIEHEQVRKRLYSFIKTALPKLYVQYQALLGGNSFLVDVMVSDRECAVLIDVVFANVTMRSLRRLASSMAPYIGELDGGILLILPPNRGTEFYTSKRSLRSGQAVWVISPELRKHV
jgi:hypothetical protein